MFGFLGNSRPGKAFALFVCLLLAAISGAQESVKVVGVSDGDTVKVLTSEKKELRVRLDGIDAPESAQPFGSASKKWLSDQVFGKTVKLYPKELDRYGRTVGRIEIDGKNVNLASVRAGMAWWYRQYAPASKELKAAEAEARAAKRGIWSEPRAVAPWEWRRGSRSPSTDGNFKSPGSSSQSPARTSGQGSRRTEKPVPAPAVGTIVYVTRTGSKYHADGCRYLSRSRIPMAKKDAVKVYDACSVCGGG
jgi:endonuclease YncB( thermonuclease family)